MLLVLSAHLLAFFVLTLACHGELARTRPDPAHLTGFYLLLSAGGVLGGAFNALIAPALFNRLIEYPLTLVLVCFALLPAFGPNPSTKSRIVSLAWPASIGILTYLLFHYLRPFEIDYTKAPVTVPILLALPAFLSFFLSKRGVQFALAAGAIFLVSNLHESFEDRLLFSQRSFFGVHRVVIERDNHFHVLYHGKTFHGQQSTDPVVARNPVAYYHPSGPIGQLFNTIGSFPNNHIAIVGLGTGALAAYSKPHERWTFYELDPVVSSIASNPKLFTYLRDALAPIKIVLGDARLSLADAPDATYGLIVLDAYSSSAIPVHLLTREALQLYLQKLAPGGLLAFHVSNVHLSLTPVVATLAHDADLHFLHRIDDASSTSEVDGIFPSEWVLLTRDESALAPIAETGLWRGLAPNPHDEIWTDSHSAVARAIWHKLRNQP
jgi:SAM-dependent methyltransferase